MLGVMESDGKERIQVSDVTQDWQLREPGHDGKRV